MTRFASFLLTLAFLLQPATAATGVASYYAKGKRTANGEVFNPHGLTAAHRSLPFGTKLKVTNIRTGKSVIVRVNDRGPFSHKRVLDLSLGAAKAIGMTGAGVARVSYDIITPSNATDTLY